MNKILIPIIIISVLVCAMLGYIFFTSTPHKQSVATDATPTPAIPVKDFAPNLPMDQKTTIVIQSADSSMEKYIVPTSQVAVYIKNLPQGNHVISQAP